MKVKGQLKRVDAGLKKKKCLNMNTVGISPDRRQSVMNTFVSKFASNQAVERQTLVYFNKLFGQGRVKVIRYEDIGADTLPYFPDWYMLTTAYKLEFSGMTTYEHFASLFNPRSENNAKSRIIRWIKEKKIVVFCDRMDKLSIVSSMLVMLMTFTTTIWGVVFQVEGQCNYSQFHLKSSIAGYIIKLILSGIPMVINLINVYKRTTVPKPGTLVKDFRRFSIIRPNQVCVSASG